LRRALKAPVTRRFRSLKEFSEATGQEKHSVLVDYDIFLKVTPPDPKDPQRIYKPVDYDFALKLDSLVVDAGASRPNITDGFSGESAGSWGV
jgi:hypothetical protein